MVHCIHLSCVLEISIYENFSLFLWVVLIGGFWRENVFKFKYSNATAQSSRLTQFLSPTKSRPPTPIDNTPRKHLQPMNSRTDLTPDAPRKERKTRVEGKRGTVRVSTGGRLTIK